MKNTVMSYNLSLFICFIIFLNTIIINDSIIKCNNLSSLANNSHKKLSTTYSNKFLNKNSKITLNKTNLETKNHLFSKLSNKTQVRNNSKANSQSLLAVKSKIKSKNKAQNKSKTNIKNKIKLSSKTKSKINFMLSNKISLRNKTKEQTYSNNRNSLSSDEFTRSPKPDMNTLIKADNKTNYPPTSQIEETLNTSIYYQNWVKYYKSFEITSDSQNYLFKNDKFYKQAVEKNELNKKDKSDIFVNIPSPESFYLIINKDFITISNNKDLSFNNIIDSIDLNQIRNINSIESQNAIKKLADYNGEKNCFKLFFNSSSNIQGDNNFIDMSKTPIWIICSESNYEESELINVILNKKLEYVEKRKSKNDNIKNLENNYYDKLLEDQNKEVLKISEQRVNKENINIGDGYWQLLNEWSECNLACGGGESKQQWMCIPPSLNTGKTCQGENILVKKCNIKPCPNGNNEFSRNNNNAEVMDKNPIVRTQSYINRPQRYEKFVVMEKDVLLLIEDPGTSSSSGLNSKFTSNQKIPARLVMNTNTVSLYLNDNLDSSIFSVNLKEAKIIQHKNDYCCLKFSMTTKYVCGGFADPCGTQINPIFMNLMMTYLNEFLKVYKQPEKKMLKPEIPEEVMDHLKLDIISNTEDKIKENINKKIEDDLSVKEKTVEKDLSKILKREYNLEKIIEEEEKAKAKQETEFLVQAKKKALEKKECLENIFKSKKKEAEKKFQYEMKLNNIEEMKTSAKEDLQLQRENFKKKLIDIRKKARRKYHKIEKEISIIRNEMTDDLIKAQHKGDDSNCLNKKHDELLRNEYCNSTQITSANHNYYCKTEEEFCDYCCGYEFGAMFVKEEAECLKKCNS